MSNSATSVLLAIVLYLVLNAVIRFGTSQWLRKHTVRLPRRFFAPERFARMREAWSDGAVATFGLAFISALTGQDLLLTAALVLVSITSIVMRTLGDYQTATLSSIQSDSSVRHYPRS